jgi:F-type H+-transporting ATPase subunit alpha
VTQNQLNRGVRLTEILKQPQFSPLPTEKQVVIIFAGTNGYLDDLKVEDIHGFEEGLYTYLDSGQSQLLKDIIEKKTLDDDLKNRIKAALTEYKENYLAEHQEAKLKESSVKPLSDEDKKKAATDQQQKEVAAKA